MMNRANGNGVALLNRVYHLLRDGDCPPAEAMDDLFAGLFGLRMDLSPDEWREFARRVAWPHPLKEILVQDPITRRSLEKPRGYAGDAELLDFIYGYRDKNHLSEMGAAIHYYLIGRPAAQAVRQRRALLATMIDQIAEEIPSPRVLSVACGHLREAHLSEAVQSGRLSEYVALDQDEESLGVVARQFSHLGVRTVARSVRELLAGRNGNGLGRFDFAYATGLYDYLIRPYAQKLTASLCRLLNPGGRLLIANFRRGIEDVGYMETYMDWHLIFRDADDMADLASLIPSPEIARQRVFTEENENTVFLEIAKKESEV